MRHKMIFKSVALSALLLSAISGSVFADEGSDAPKTSSPLVKITKAVAAIPFSSPLELAKTYAPETVGAWETTLAKYDELIGVNNSGIYSIEDGKAVKVVSIDGSLDTQVTVLAVPAAYSEKGLTAGTDLGVVATMDPSDMEFFEGRIELSQAEQGKDTAAIKQLLSKLLELYKQQITKLEASN